MSDDDLKTFYHRLIEVFKHAYAKRSIFGDEDFIDMQSIYDNLNNDTFIDTIRNKIKDDKVFPQSYYGGTTFKDNKGTGKHSSLNKKSKNYYKTFLLVFKLISQ